MPPLNSMFDEVSTTRLIGWPSASTAAWNGPHCDGARSVSITVTPSASTTAPALVRPWPGVSASSA